MQDLDCSLNNKGKIKEVNVVVVNPNEKKIVKKFEFFSSTFNQNFWVDFHTNSYNYLKMPATSIEKLNDYKNVIAKRVTTKTRWFLSNLVY